MMKKLLTIPVRLLFPLAAAGLFFSCDKPSDDNGDDTPDVPAESVDVHAGGYYAEDPYGIGSDNFLVYIADNGVTMADYTFSGEGTALLVDFNAPATGKPELSPGVYNALLEESGDGESQDFTFLPGVNMGAWGITGSFIYSKAEGADPVYTMVEDGSVEVKLYEDALYQIIAHVKTAGGEYDFEYVGRLEYGDNPSGEDPDPAQGKEIEGLVNGEMAYYGQAYGDTGTDYANWVITLSAETFDPVAYEGEGTIMQIEVNTSSKDTEKIPSGTYTVFTVIDGASFVPFSAVPAFLQGTAPYGTWYLDIDSDLNVMDSLGATSGEIEISEKDGVYSISFELEDAENKESFYGSYEGELTYSDYSSASQSAQACESSARHLKKTHPATFPGRKVMKK